MLALAATGCERVGGSAAATVAGHDISTDRVLSLMKDRKVAADRDAKTGTAANLAGPGKDTFTKRAFAETLNQVVLAELLQRELERRHLQVTSADRKSARFSLEQSAGASTVRKLPKGLRSFVIEFSAGQMKLQKQLGKKVTSKEAQARAQYDKIKSATPEQLSQLCVTGAVFAAKADATTARNRIAAGAAVTKAVKGLKVQQVAAQEQCAAAAKFPPELKSLKVGGVTAPIASQGTFVVLRLEKRKTLAFAEVRAQIEKNIPEPGAAELQAAIGKLVAKAKVHVDPRYGRWNRQAGRVDPPAGTPTTSAPADPAVTAPAGGSPGAQSGDPTAGAQPGDPTGAPPTAPSGG